MRSIVSRRLWKLNCTVIHCTLVVRGVGGGKVSVFGNAVVAVVEFTDVGERLPINVLVIDTQDDVILGAKCYR